jgi:hypothetical protein
MHHYINREVSDIHVGGCGVEPTVSEQRAMPLSWCGWAMLAMIVGGRGVHVKDVMSLIAACKMYQIVHMWCHIDVIP